MEVEARGEESRAVVDNDQVDDCGDGDAENAPMEGEGKEGGRNLGLHPAFDDNVSSSGHKLRLVDGGLGSRGWCLGM